MSRQTIASWRNTNDCPHCCRAPRGLNHICANLPPLSDSEVERRLLIEENARLIAAAPELLAACQRLIHAQSSGLKADWLAALLQAEHAIAKATGEDK